MTRSKKKFEKVEFSPEDIELWLDTLHDGRGFYDPETGYDSSGFYQRCGFLYVNSAEILPPSSGYRTMYFDLKPLLDTLGVLG